MANDTTSSIRVRRSDAGLIRLTSRDGAGLCLVAEQYAAPYDLLATALGVQQPRLRQVLARWRAAGYARTQVLAPGPAWCWLTAAGIATCGYPWTARAPALARLAHLRAVLAARMWLASTAAWQQGQAQWRPERDLRAASGSTPSGHLPDAEVMWPSVDGSPHPGECWALEVELTPKTATRTAAILAGLLDGPYAQVAYLTSPAARPVVTRAASRFPAAQAARIVIRDLPATGRMPQVTQ
jgi:hypothetical protein